MKRVLLTGMSGTGKSSVVRALVARGHKAVDTDDGYVEELPDNRQRWREDAVEELLDTEDTEVLFVAGSEENQVRFHPRFDHIVLLSAPPDVVIERVSTRRNNPFGSTAADRQRILADLEAVEPLLRRVAHHEVVTTVPLDEVVSTVLRLVDASPYGDHAATRD